MFSLVADGVCWQAIAGGAKVLDAMADVVNLNRFRKRKQREADKREAEQNRVVHGLSKAEKQALRRERERAERSLAAHRREPGDTDDPTTGDSDDEPKS